MFLLLKSFNWYPNTKYPPNTKNYLPCLVIGGRLVLAGRDYHQTQQQYKIGTPRSYENSIVWCALGVPFCRPKNCLRISGSNFIVGRSPSQPLCEMKFRYVALWQFKVFAIPWFSLYRCVIIH